MPSIRVSIDDFDKDPYVINTPMGLIDLRTGNLVTGKKVPLVSKRTSVAPGPTGMDRWEDFLGQTFQGDCELIEYVQRLVGVSILGTAREDLFVICRGRGRNGKTAFMESISRALGDYAATAPKSILLSTRNESHPTDIASLAGIRLASASEVNVSDILDEAKAKLVTGGDTMSVRKVFKDFRQMTPSHTLWMLCNHMPQIRVGGHALWRRVRVVPFNNNLRRENEDSSLRETLQKRAGSAILQWAIEGAVSYLADGLGTSDAVEIASREALWDSDPIAKFIDQFVITDEPRARVKRKDLYEEYCRQSTEVSQMSPQVFYDRIRRASGATDKRSNGNDYFEGIELRSPRH